MKKIRAKKYSLGFTLIELIMVMVVAGIVGAMVIPRFANQATFQARFFTEDVLAAVRFAQNHAKTTGCHVRFQITNANFFLARNAKCANPAKAINYVNGNIVRPGGGNDGDDTGIPNGVTLQRLTNRGNWVNFANNFTWTVAFLPDGSATTNDLVACNGIQQFRVTGGGVNTAVTVDCATGYVNGS